MCPDMYSANDRAVSIAREADSGRVNPIYYVFFTTATIIASAILFQGFNTTDAANTLSLICGFLIIFMGVYLLNISRQPEAPHHANSLEAGLMSEFISPSGYLGCSPRKEGDWSANQRGRLRMAIVRVGTHI
jgi:hypothetical protein